MSDELAYKCRRKNYVHAAYVSASLSLVKAGNCARAEAMLKNLNVLDTVIERVLSKGSVRKKKLVSDDQYLIAASPKQQMIPEEKPPQYMTSAELEEAIRRHREHTKKLLAEARNRRASLPHPLPLNLADEPES